MGVWYFFQLCPGAPIAQEHVNNKLQACLPPHWLTKQNHPWKMSRDAWKLSVHVCDLLPKASNYNPSAGMPQLIQLPLKHGPSVRGTVPHSPLLPDAGARHA